MRHECLNTVLSSFQYAPGIEAQGPKREEAALAKIPNETFEDVLGENWVRSKYIFFVLGLTSYGITFLYFH